MFEMCLNFIVFFCRIIKGFEVFLQVSTERRTVKIIEMMISTSGEFQFKVGKTVKTRESFCNK